ncbi:MAG: ScyD/ScyE family protein [Bacteroidetes bacterium]|nr:ScyD/ScyE family protein [Fibrella sp.]
MNYKRTALGCLLAGVLLTSCQEEQDQVTASMRVTTLASGFVGPIGVETDARGRVWVSESGSGKNDGQVSMVTADGTKYPVITELPSTPFMNEVSGTDHILFADGVLYILDKSKLYKANVAGFNPGDAPIKASSLTPEDIGQFVLNYPFVNNTRDTHLYNMTLGPDGALYIADAAANAIIRRATTGALSVLAEIPGIPNTTPVGPRVIESVPTGIVYDGQKFLVSTLLGFPFPSGRALVYQVDLTGNVSIYQSGFSSLVDVNLNQDAVPGPLVLEHGQFGPMGFAANTGRLLKATGTGSAVLLSGLNLPTDVEQADDRTYYITSLGNGNLLKATY